MEHPVVWTVVTVGIATLLMYGLTVGTAVDAMDDVVIATLSGTGKADVILVSYYVLLGLAFAAGVVATFRSARGIEVVAISLWAGSLAALVVEFAVVLLLVPRFPLTWEGLMLVPAAFTYYTTPAGFLVLHAAAFLAFMVVASKLSGVE